MVDALCARVIIALALAHWGTSLLLNSRARGLWRSIAHQQDGTRVAPFIVPKQLRSFLPSPAKYRCDGALELSPDFLALPQQPRRTRSRLRDITIAG